MLLFFLLGLADLSVLSDSLGFPLLPSALQKVILIFNSRKVRVMLQVPSSTVVLNSTDNWKISLIVEIWVASTFYLQKQHIGTDFPSFSKLRFTCLFVLSPLSSYVFYEDKGVESNFLLHSTSGKKKKKVIQSLPKSKNESPFGVFQMQLSNWTGVYSKSKKYYR